MTAKLKLLESKNREIVRQKMSKSDLGLL